MFQIFFITKAAKRSRWCGNNRNRRRLFSDLLSGARSSIIISRTSALWLVISYIYARYLKSVNVYTGSMLGQCRQRPVSVLQTIMTLVVSLCTWVCSCNGSIVRIVRRRLQEKLNYSIIPHHLLDMWKKNLKHYVWRFFINIYLTFQGQLIKQN